YTRMAHEQPSRRLVGEFDPPLAVDRQERRRRIVQHCLVEATVIAEALPLVPQALDALFQRLAELAEAAPLMTIAEALLEIAETHRVHEAREFDIGALDVAPQAGHGARENERGKDAGGAQP